MSSALPSSFSRFFLVRHGESKPNVAKLIVSDPEEGTSPHQGLTENGKSQARESAKQFKQSLLRELDLLENGGMEHGGFEVRIVSSDFRRALETAEIFQKELSGSPSSNVLKGLNVSPRLTTSPKLRERNFGPLYENKSSDLYHQVWEHDAKQEVEDGVESPEEVQRRAWSLVQECLTKAVEANDAGKKEVVVVYVLVSHGDTLQVSESFNFRVAFCKLLANFTMPLVRFFKRRFLVFRHGHIVRYLI
jgi:probable phosphoglycerate mutase